MSDLATCGNCGRTWDDSIITSMTPAPAARCPFEYFHDGEEVPSDHPVQPISPYRAGCIEAAEHLQRVLGDNWKVEAV